MKSNAGALTCNIASFVTTDVAAQLQTQIEYNATSPVLQYFTVNVANANSFITVRLDDSDDDLATHMRVLLNKDTRPTYADTIIPNCDQYLGNGEEITECLFLAPEAGAYKIGIFTTQTGVVDAPPREVFVTFDVSPYYVQLNSNVKVTVTVPAGGNAYFITPDPDESTALFLRVTSSKQTTVKPYVALDTFPTYFSSLTAPQIVQEEDTADPANVLVVSIVEASVLRGAVAHVRLYNSEFTAVTYTVELVYAQYQRVLPGVDKIVSLSKGYNGLYRTILDGTDNVLIITLTHDAPLGLWIRKDIPPTIDVADADFISDITTNKDGKTVSRAIWAPSQKDGFVDEDGNGEDDRLNPAGTWYFRVVPSNNTLSTTFSLSIAAGHATDVGPYSEIGGRLVRGGVDYYFTRVSVAQTFGLYVAVESKGALTDSLFYKDTFPTNEEHTDRVSSRSYQESWGYDGTEDDHWINEHYIMPKDLNRGNWSFSVYTPSGPALSYSLTSVLFEIFAIKNLDDVEAYPLSSYKMAVLTYTFAPAGNQHTDTLTIKLTPADGIDVIVSRDIIPFTFEHASDKNSAVSVADNTLTLSLNSATAGTYYYRVLAKNGAVKDVQASVHIGKIDNPVVPSPVTPKTPTGGQAVAPSDGSSNNGNNSPAGNNLLLILIVVFLGLLVVILTVVVVMFVLRNKRDASAEMTNIGGDAKYSLLNEEGSRP